MSFTDTLTLDDATGDAVTYALIGRDLNGSSRINTATTATEPANFVIKHSRSGANSNVVDRHLVQVTKTKSDTAGVSRTAIVNLTIAVPRSAVITQDDVIDMVSNLIDFIADGGFSDTGIAGTVALTALLRGES